MITLGQEMEEYIARRCDEELNKDKRYMEIQAELSDAYKKHDIDLYCRLSMEMQPIVEKVCYKTAAIDLLSE
jgi:hypothetical protein